MTRQTKGQRAVLMKAYRATRRAEIAAQEKHYREQNSEQVSINRKRYREENREKVLAQSRDYRQAHREEITAQRKAYRAAHPEEAARVKAYHDSHAEERRAYRASRREETTIIAVNSRARKQGASGTISVSDWRALRAWFGNVCLCCGGAEKLTVDHVVPITKNGGNVIANVQPLCDRCNKRKSQKATDYRDPSFLTAFLTTLTNE